MTKIDSFQSVQYTSKMLWAVLMKWFNREQNFFTDWLITIIWFSENSHSQMKAIEALSLIYWWFGNLIKIRNFVQNPLVWIFRQYDLH